MCGIAGWLENGPRSIDIEILGQMTESLAHRGPDDSGVFVKGPIGLGHRRLSIIDLSRAGHQPMITPSARYAISYNGEVYNFRELKAELMQAGREFQTQTDTEVVLAAFEIWGPSCFKKFNGMFALAIWDNQEQALYLARDRYGVKPLYLFSTAGTLLFASEIKALLRHPGVRCEIDKQGLTEYFTFQNFFASRTLYKNISTFPAGHWAKVEAKRPDQIAWHQYWDFDFQEPESGRAESSYIEELDFLFQQSVKRQMMSDVPVGSYLSGGIDSGSIATIASQNYKDLQTFTVGFDTKDASILEQAFDERDFAREMAMQLKTQHHEKILVAGDMERCLLDLTWHIEEPRVGQSYPIYYAAKMASQSAKVVLSGAGGDEVFAGYPWRYYRAVNNQGFDDFVSKYYSFWQRLVPDEQMAAMLAPIWSDVRDFNTRDVFKSVFGQRDQNLTRPEDFINHSLYFEAKTFLHGLLVIEDKISMAHGLETRVPFLDNDLVDFAMRVPASMKLRNLQEVIRFNENEPAKNKKYFEKTNDGKLILRRVMERHVPKTTTARVKQGFSGPDATWFKGKSNAFVQKILGDKNSSLFEFLDRETVHSLVEEHMSGKVNRRLLIWSLITFETWCGLFLDGKPEAATQKPKLTNRMNNIFSFL